MEKGFKKGDKVVIESIITDIEDDKIYIRSEVEGFVIFNESEVKHAEPEFVPREMMVWNKDGDIAQKRFISGIFDGWYMYKEEWGGYYSYRNAKEMPQELEKVSDEQLLKTFEAWLKQIKK